MEITEMTLNDLEQMKNTLYSDFDNFWSYNVLKKELENENDEILKTDIDNYLEILLEKIDKAIACYERVTDLIIQNQE